MKIKIGVAGSFETVPELVTLLLDENIPALEKELKNGWDINQEIKISEHTSLLPITIALYCEKEKTIHWLIQNKADLNDKAAPAFLNAVRCCNEKIVRFIAQSGANITALNKVGNNAYEIALYGKNFEILPVIHELGCTVKDHAGGAFRQAVSARNYKAIDFFIKNGVDINYNKPDMVYPFKPTPLSVAVRYVDFDMVKYLVEHGADVKIAEKDGERPYTIAVTENKTDIAQYLKALEPADFHNLSNKLQEIKKLKLDADLLEFLQSEHLKINLPDNELGIHFIEFMPLIDTVVMKFGRSNFLRISKKVDNYGDLILVWNPKEKGIGCVDLEHKEYRPIGTFKALIANPEIFLNYFF